MRNIGGSDWTRTRSLPSKLDCKRARVWGTKGGYGDYYAPLGTTPEQIGLDPNDVAETFQVNVTTETKDCLFSTHVKQSELYYDQSRKSVGGGTQIFSEELKNNATFIKIQ